MALDVDHSHSPSLVTTSTPNYNTQLTTGTTSVSDSMYVYPNYPNYYVGGYTCGRCGSWVSHNTYHQCVPLQVVTIIPTVVTPAPDPTQKEILEELKLMRKALETLADRTHNEHEEVRRCDDGGSEDSPTPEGRGREGSFKVDISATAEVAKRLGL